MIRKKSITKNRALPKSPTGIKGLDEITGGGLPKGRPTLICGGAGCGKSMLGVEFLVRGAMEFNEPGVLMTFEETPEDVIKNARSLGFDIDDLVAKKKLFWISCVSSAVRFRRRASMIWKGFLSG